MIPINSPHLRKSGSRLTVSDLGNFIYKSLDSICTILIFIVYMHILSIHLILVWFPGVNETDDGVDDEGLFHSTDANDSKGATIPISATTIMPSPILLWRFKVLFTFWETLGAFM